MIATATKLILSGWFIAAVVMTALWFRQRRTNNAGIVDVGWAATIGSLAVLYAIFSDADIARRIFVAVMGLAWGLRLASHIHARSHGKPEDGRYTQLRKQWAPHEQLEMLKFYQLQAATVAFFSIPFIPPLLNTARGLSAIEIIAGILWLIALTGEAAADAQLERFKKRGLKGTTCRDGLWNYSRHPNYFFEWLIWCAFALFASASPFGFIAWLCPATIMFLLFKVTGIPATEAQALRTKGDDYRDYQRTTNAFFPWFPRKDIAHVVRTAA
jgi:steroid 5-alpha reductase family enzyme